MAYTETYGGSPQAAPGTGSVAATASNMQNWHGILILFFFFLALHLMLEFGAFRKINNAL